MNCAPPQSAPPLDLVFDVEETAVDTVLDPPDDTFIARLGPFTAGTIGGPGSAYASSTVRIDKTLTLLGPARPVLVKWVHHTIDPESSEESTSDEEQLITSSWNWPVGDDEEWDDSFTLHRHPA